MRNVLKNSSGVFHYWANKVQPAGRAGNVFFEDEKAYSYGRHFCIARHLPNGVVAFTTRSYSPTTSGHVSEARSAARHLQIVHCYDPSESAASNQRHASDAIALALGDAEKPRIRQHTRDAHKARALRIAENFNAYLYALPADERAPCTRFDLTGLEHIRVVMQQHEETQRRLQADAAVARNREAADRLQAWKVDPTILAAGFHGLPVALRLRAAEEPGTTLRIQTSHGAEIPAYFARRLWAMIEAARSTGRSMENIGAPCGVYTLNTVCADGSIVVGCHDIPYSELHRVAVLLGFIETQVAA